MTSPQTKGLLHDIRELLVINTIILGLLAIMVAYLVGYYTS